ncbi:MAG: DegV family EDD domain-containing protein [Candidatus Izimaplasma sp.]|nr:DegV family EDD domain-containing protein [Candidatus Izimaplasma bacterium]
MTMLNGTDLFNMFAHGTSYVMKQRNLLNDINVFPVPDGDTGNNLVHTMQTIYRESNHSENFSETLDSISDSALIGARGNSGVIFAQFVNGLNLSNKHQSNQIPVNEFVDMVCDSVTHTYASLSNPVEGTMITVIRHWAESLKEHLGSMESIKHLFSGALTRAKESLEKTKETLEVLKKNNVVDSGAKGFVLFVEGMLSYFNGDTLDLDENEVVELEDTHEFEGDITFRYCTEGLVRAKHIEEDDVRAALSDLGDSLIVAMGKHLFRVHIHTNTPEQVFKRLGRFGNIESQKIDDMKMDIALKNRKNKRVIVTDSIGDIDKDILLDENIVVIPIFVNVDQVQYLDKLSMTNETLFEYVDEALAYPTTSAPSIKYVNDLFNRLLLRFDEILVLTVSSNLSATYNIIKAEADKLTKKGKNIEVIDTLTNSGAQGLLVTKAAEMMKEGRSTEDIVNIIKDDLDKTEILVCLETFKYATMSGRLPKVVGKIGMTLGIRPIMTINKKGEGAAFGMALSQKGITKKIKKYVEKELTQYGIERYSLVHCLNQDLLEEYEALFTDIIGKKPEFKAEVSSAVAVHSGIGSVAISYIKK